MILSKRNLLLYLDEFEYWESEHTEGCNEYELKELMEAAPGKLPDSYLDVMSLIGKRAGDFLDDVGFTFCYPEVITLRERIVEQCPLHEFALSLPTSAFPFFSYYLEEFLFFDLGGEEDRNAVWRWFDEEPDSFHVVCGSVWEFLSEQIK